MEFKRYHPIVNFLYLVTVIGFSCFFMNPICLGISLISSLLYRSVLKLKSNLGYILPMFLVMAVMNPLFNHEGATILAYLPDSNPLTLESIIYGICAAVMLASVICWFSCYNEVMTSDKFIYIFGRIIPSLSLVLSMTLRFVPRFKEQTKKVMEAQKAIGQGVSDDSIIKRAKNGLSIVSVMITWSMENAIETADSMKSRGYGLSGRTAYSIYSFDKRDKIALISIILLSIYIMVGNINDAMYFVYFPAIIRRDISFYSISVFFAYILLCNFPVLIEVREARKWKILKSKI